MGGITKAEIGAIRVFDRETKFEIVGGAAERFLASAMASGSELVVSATTAPGVGPVRDLGPRPAKVKPARAPAARGQEQVRRKKNRAKKGIGF
jgi:ATP-dependent RNA helicase DeaD